jgi:hypothetical protein
MSSQRRHEGYAMEKEPKVRAYGVLPLPIGDNQPFGAGANMFLHVLSLDT